MIKWTITHNEAYTGGSPYHVYVNDRWIIGCGTYLGARFFVWRRRNWKYDATGKLTNRELIVWEAQTDD